MSLASFSFTHTPPSEIYTLSLHDALPIYVPRDSALCRRRLGGGAQRQNVSGALGQLAALARPAGRADIGSVLPDRKSTRLNSSHLGISYAVFCLKKKNNKTNTTTF